MDPTLAGGLIGAALTIMAAVLILWTNKKGDSESSVVGETKLAAPVPVAPVPTASAPVQKPDDLVLIEGIGPKIALILNQKGITTFAQLGAMPPADLKALLKENGLQFAKPDSWPEQALLAAAGKMDELKALQERLVAGR